MYVGRVLHKDAFFCERFMLFVLPHALTVTYADSLPL